MNDMLLHVLPQYDNHTSVMIYGTADGLAALADAVFQSIDNGGTAQSRTVFARDGEGYHIEVKQRTAEEMNAIPLPYAQLGHSWDFPDRAAFAALKAENERLREQLQLINDKAIMNKGEFARYIRENSVIPATDATKEAGK